MRLETDRLVLRNFNKNDAERLFRMCSADKNYYRFTTIPYPYKKKDAIEFLRKAMYGYRTKNSLHLAVVQKNNNLLVGGVSLNKISKEHRSAILGYHIDKKYAKKGYATEAALTLIDYAFKKQKLNRIEIGCSVTNHTSRRIIRKLGAKQEGVARQVMFIRSKFMDAYVHSILRKEWKRKTNYKIRK